MSTERKHLRNKQQAAPAESAFFSDRADAGRRLAKKLASYVDKPNTVVLGLPRGGIPVAFEVAQALKAPLDVFIVRKLGLPNRRELAIGAIAGGGVFILNEPVIELYGVSDDVINSVAAKERLELDRQEKLYRAERAPVQAAARTVILVDDGLATGSTMRAAVAALRVQKPRRIVVAVPVASPAAYAELRTEADETICLITPDPLQTVGIWYEDFSQVNDDEVRKLLGRSTST